MEREKEKRLRDLLLKATQDMEFRERFLKDPAVVGKKNGVSFTKEQLENIKSVANFIESLKDLRIPVGPIGYPLGPVLQRWRMREIVHVLRYFVFYPAPWIIHQQVQRERYY